MATSTSVFAPTVRNIQPAFVYDKNNKPNIKIYFSLSPHNKADQIDGLKYSVTDPTQKAIWGNNSMFSESISTYAIGFDTNKFIDGEYYFEIDSTELNDLTLNQYYQVQIYLKERNTNNYSAPSQVTLIRPISQPTLTINGWVVPEGGDSIELSAAAAKDISGFIEYDDGSTKEYLSRYRIIISQVGGAAIYQTAWIGNVAGLSFATKLDFIFNEGQSYKVKFIGETVNGYIIIKEDYNISIKGYSENDKWQNFFVKSIQDDKDAGAVKIVVILSEKDWVGTLKVQRTRSDLVESLWEDVCSIQITDSMWREEALKICIYDYFTAGDYTPYEYRFLGMPTDGNSELIARNNYTIKSSFDDIFLSDSKRQLSIKYNPNISKFQWITQESITNSLGGKYPIIRRNGDTKYRQFPLSGTLYFEPSILSINSSVDSRNTSMEEFLSREDSTLFLSVEEAWGRMWNPEIWSEQDFNEQLFYYEQKFKNAAIDFLTDGKPKLFRSPTEGFMLVRLTNVSFTPQQKLGRKIVDFSATVTEFAEATYENLIRYGIKSQAEYTDYILSAVAFSNYDEIIATAYISDSKIGSVQGSSNQIYLTLEEKKIRV